MEEKYVIISTEIEKGNLLNKLHDEKLKKLKADLVQFEICIEGMRKEKVELVEMNTNLQRHNASLTEHINVLKAQLASFEDKSSSEEETSSEEEPVKEKLMLIMDSNGKKIWPALKNTLSDYDITNIEGIYNTTQLLNYFADKKELKESNNIILQGTNDPSQISGTESLKNIIELQKMELKNTMFIQIPAQKKNN